MRKGIVLAVVLLLVMASSAFADVRTGKIMLGGEFHIGQLGYPIDANICFTITNPNDAGTIKVYDIKFYNPDGTEATLKTAFPLPQTLVPHESRGYSMVTFFNNVPSQPAWHGENYTWVVYWQGNVHCAPIATTWTVYYTPADRKILAIGVNLYDNRSLDMAPPF